jgi:hypothetical protein
VQSPPRPRSRAQPHLHADAGISRFWDMVLAQRGNWPNMTRMHELDPRGDKIFVRKDRTRDYRLPADLYKFMCGSGNGFQGPLIGGPSEARLALLLSCTGQLKTSCTRRCCPWGPSATSRCSCSSGTLGTTAGSPRSRSPGDGWSTFLEGFICMCEWEA